MIEGECMNCGDTEADGAHIEEVPHPENGMMVLLCDCCYDIIADEAGYDAYGEEDDSSAPAAQKAGDDGNG